VTRSFDEVHEGDAIPESTRLVTREDIKAYADASGDQNPLHQNDDVARAAGFSGVIAHGMFTMGHLASSLLDWAGEGAALMRLRVQFRSPVFPGETLIAGGSIKSLDPERRTVTLDVWVRVDRDGAAEWPIRRAEAELQLA
jgi:acyl dehydratase